MSRNRQSAARQNLRRQSVLALSTALALAGATTMGQAAGYDVETPGVIVVPTDPQTANWSGFYGGVSLGQGNATIDWQDENGGWFTGFLTGETHDFDMNGTGGGLQIGYNWQTPGNLVFGVELSGLALDLEDDDDSPFFPASDRLSASIHNPLALTGHLGYATGRWLPYVEAGVAQAQVGLKNTDDFCLPDCEFDSEERHTGYVAGLGVGYKVSPRSALGINYRHYDFGNATHDGTTSGVAVDESFDTKATLGVVSVWWNFYLN